ncbi:2-methylaconitate cis-trans isomerase PrpF family protein [Cupriavidus numazuensis]|uniref:3-methylitaconate isomerase n=1 Tax=Cupriavidus numazuensis TaxID=221992 RepID=A0ABM8TLW0_9BURK|nr:PrpF domain-containing protein [Cupriavidus numazuensis]CAG2154158.1 3-methylitaconate isomerase [Cupriavidus numazuensis]
MAQFGTHGVIYRGGTSKALLVRTSDLPTQVREELGQWLLAVYGSPDPRQIDGIGGADPLTSKFGFVGPASRPDADVDYTFAQVGIHNSMVDWSIMCGNILSAIGPYAIDEGLVQAVEPITTVRIHNTNTGKVVVARVEVSNGKPKTTGDTSIDGVPGTGSPILLDFKYAAGAKTGKLLPTGNRRDVAEVPGVGLVEYSVVDIAGMQVFVKASAFGLTGTEDPLAYEKMTEVGRQIEYLRRKVAVDLGFASSIETARAESPMTPFSIIVGPPQDWQLYGTQEKRLAHNCDVAARCVFDGGMHKAFPGTGAIPTAVAAAIEGTVVHDVARAEAHAEGAYRIGHPSGTLAVDVELNDSGAGVEVQHASLVRTARRLFEGTVFTEPSRLWRDFDPSLVTTSGEHRGY